MEVTSIKEQNTLPLVMAGLSQQEYLKPCPNCESDLVGVGYSDGSQSNPAVGCMSCGLLVMSADSKESSALKLWETLPRKSTCFQFFKPMAI